MTKYYFPVGVSFYNLFLGTSLRFKENSDTKLNVFFFKKETMNLIIF